jgi:hypothetical protein
VVVQPVVETEEHILDGGVWCQHRSGCM